MAAELLESVRGVLKDIPSEVPDVVLTTFSELYAPIRSHLAVWEGAALKTVDELSGTSFSANYAQFLKTEINPHSRKLPLMNPFDAVVIATLYLVVVLVLRIVFGFTRDGLRNNFLMKQYVRLHNLFLVLLSGYMAFEVVRQALLTRYSLWGNGVVQGKNGWPMAKIIWVFYVSKIPEFGDTIIMALRKSYAQITFLHLYHHFTIFVIWWYVVFMAPGGESYFSAALNSFVHVIMYAYYFFAAFGIEFRFKYYITKFQMLQFFANFLQAAYDVTTKPKGFPLVLSWILLVYMVTLLFLFYNFLVTNKAKKNAAKKTKAQ